MDAACQDPIILMVMYYLCGFDACLYVCFWRERERVRERASKNERERVRASESESESERVRVRERLIKEQGGMDLHLSACLSLWGV